MPAGTKYYDPQAGGIKSVFQWQATVFEMVFKKREFWCYILWNLFLTSGFIFAVPDNKVDEFNWDAASIMQYVMTFFVTFYNDMCFMRYEKLYPEVVNFSDGVVDIVQELAVNLHWQDLIVHRVACTKYLLAIVYEHFMMVCGGKLHEENWNELIYKGLLTEQEVCVLKEFPGGKIGNVLSTWVMFIVKDALVQDCLWRKDYKSYDTSQQTVHIYNRFVKHMNSMMKSMHQIGYTMANPIPFAYYHLMNFILLFNIMLLATFSALYKSYASVFPFGIALLIYMGLREVSTALADPFGEDAVDFCVPDILRNCFDRAICILLAFQRQEPRDWVFKQIKHNDEFQEEHLRRSCKAKVFQQHPGDKFKGPAACHMRWTMDSLFEDAPEDADLKRKMKFSLVVGGAPPDVVQIDDLEDDDTKFKRMEAQAEAEDERTKALMLNQDDLDFEIKRLGILMKEMEVKFPEVLDYPYEEVLKKMVEVPKPGEEEPNPDEDNPDLEAPKVMTFDQMFSSNDRYSSLADGTMRMQASDITEESGILNLEGFETKLEALEEQLGGSRENSDLRDEQRKNRGSLLHGRLFGRKNAKDKKAPKPVEAGDTAIVCNLTKNPKINGLRVEVLEVEGDRATVQVGNNKKTQEMSIKNLKKC